ncbi:HAMP domain-containing sensor histidine kinase [Oscillospiraceae bacterium MB08-C2-2]|nr:HAMP domain-containing sensor histidine kinase [Oscillospiraceae bacterium MB08-C2-2]
MKNGLVKKQMVVYFCSIFVSIVALGGVLLLCAFQYFKQENYEKLERNARQAAAVTVANYERNQGAFVDEQIITTTYRILSNVTDSDFSLVDTAGEVVLQQRVNDYDYSQKQAPQSVIQTVISQGYYEETGTLGGVYNSVYHTVAVPVTTSAGETIGVLFAASSARSVALFLGEILRMFLISAVIVLVLAFVVLYFVTSQMVKPLKDMLQAMQSFTRGDFSVRLPVASYDEIGQLAMAINNMASSVAALESSRRLFTANVSHELRTPMTTISGFVDGMLDGTIPEEKREQYLKIVSIEIKRLSRLVRSMLDTARIEAGELELTLSIFDISEIVRQTIFTFEARLEEKQVEIMGLETDKVLVEADVDLIHQVIYNLVDNAVKFVEDKGYISVHYHSDEEMTYIAIRNSGAGIAKEETPKLFERFYKSDKSRSLNKQGVGLGLHIVKSIINYHKGDILVRSVLGEYTEFEISLPNPKTTEGA